MGTATALLLVALAASAAAAPTTKCKQDCKSSLPSLLEYQAGTTYVYSLEGNVVTGLSGSQGPPPTVQLKANVELSAQDGCGHVLRLKNVKITGPDAKKYGSLKELEEHPVLASFNGGSYSAQLCTDDKESSVALNIKRSVLSLLQSPVLKSSHVTETDIFGNCPTDIRVSKTGDVTHIIKLKDLNRCSGREDVDQDIPAIHYVSKGDLQSTPLLDADLKVQQKIQNGIISTVESDESYLFIPFSNQDKGARTTVHTKLSFVSKSKQAGPATGSLRVQHPLHYEKPHPPAPTGSNVKAIIAALHAARDSMKIEVGPTAANKVRALVEVLRRSSQEDIFTVYGQVRSGAGFDDKQAARNLLLDALFRTGTGAAVQVAAELLKKNEISGDLAKIWYINLGLVRHATKESVASVTSLLDQGNLPHEALLGIGALANRYCKEHDCENVPEVNALLNKLGKSLGGKINSKTKENSVITSLKALKNINHLSDEVADKVLKLASDKSTSTRVRVAALETIRSDSCRKKLKSGVLDIMKNNEEDSEIRIKAYLAAVECPCNNVASAVKSLLETEHINQVGSYIVSHLRNIRASTNPSKAKAKEVFGLIRPSTSYPEDIRKYSRNYELSYMIDSLNVGASVEADVIFSQNVYIPKSVTVNLTTEMFGHSYSVLELSARGENIDRVLEHYFGPKGFYNTHELSELVSDGNDKLKSLNDKIMERFKNLGRSKRSVSKDEVEALRNKVLKTLATDPGNNALDVDLGLTVGGSEVSWFSFDKDIKDLTADGIVNKVFDSAENIIKQAEKFDHNFKHHSAFLDTEVTYPTGLGFPLKLVVDGSSAVHLKLNGGIDIPTLLKEPGKSHVKFEVIPSAAIEINGELSVDAYAVESGLKSSFQLHTATGITVEVQGLNNAGVDIKVGLPLKKQELINIKSDILNVIHERGQAPVETPVVMESKSRQFAGCFDQVQPITGIVVCGDVKLPIQELNSPTAFYPLNGPSKISLGIATDEDVPYYHLQILKEEKKKDHTAVKILLEIPSSKSDRKLTLLLERLTGQNKEIRATLTSPWKEMSLQAMIIDSDSEHSVVGKFINDGQEYSAKAGVATAGDTSKKTYTPILEYKVPTYQESLKKDVKGGSKKGGKSSQEYSVDGAVVVDKQADQLKYSFNGVTLATPQGIYKIDGYVSKDGNNHYSTDLKISYGKNGEDNYIIRNDFKLSEPEIIVSAQVQSSEYPDIGVGIKWHLKRSPDTIQNSLQIVHGNDLNSESSRISVDNYWSSKYESPSNFEIVSTNKVTYPLLQILFELGGKANPHQLAYDLKIGYSKHKFESHLDAKVNTKKIGDYDIKFQVQLEKNGIKVECNREVLSPEKSKFENKLELTPGGTYELSAQVTHILQENNIKLQLDSLLKTSVHKNEYKIDAGVILNPNLINIYGKLYIGTNNHMDVLIKINRGSSSPPSGNIKVIIKNLIDGLATYKYSNGKGTGTLQIDITRLNKIKGSGDITVSGSHYVGSAELLWNADKDPSKRLKIETDSDISSNAIDSKNVLYVLDHKTTFNLKGSIKGKLADGEEELQGETQLILPCGRELSAKVHDKVSTKQDNTNFDLSYEISDLKNKGESPRKVNVHIVAKNLNLKSLTGEAESKVTYTTPEGENLIVSVVEKYLSHTKDFEEYEAELKAAMQGSLIDKAVTLEGKFDHKKPVTKYKFNGGYGIDYTASVTGNMNLDVGKEHEKHTDHTFEVKFPGTALHQIKLSTSNTITGTADLPLKGKTSNTLIWNDVNTVKIEADGLVDKTNGNGVLSIVLPKGTEAKISTSWKDDENKGYEGSGDVDLKWENDKRVTATGAIRVPYDHDPYKLHITLKTPTDQVNSLDLQAAVKVPETSNSLLEVDSTILLNKQKYVLTSKIGAPSGIPHVDVKLTCPQGVSKIYLNAEKKSPDDIKIDVELQWVVNGGGTLISTADLKLNVDDLKIDVLVDSPALKLNKLQIKVGHSQTKGPKKLVFSIKSADKNYLSGSTTLATKTDALSVTYTGNGEVVVEDKSRKFHFDLTRKVLTEDKNNEIGYEYSTNIGISGLQSLKSLLKLSNKEFTASTKACKENENQCGIVEITSKLEAKDISATKHELKITIDLRPLNIPQGLRLEAHSENNKALINQEASLQLFNKETSTYKWTSYLKDNGAGSSLVLPTREIAAEVKVSPEKKNNVRQLSISSSLWLDKQKQPSAVTSASAVFGETTGKDNILFLGELKFIHPSLEKDLVLKGKTELKNKGVILASVLDIDLFKNKNSKIVIDGKVISTEIKDGYNISSSLDIKSKGQNIDISSSGHAYISMDGVGTGLNIYYKGEKQVYKTEALLDLCLDKLLLYVHLPNNPLIEIDGSLSKSHNLPSIKAIVNMPGVSPLVIEMVAVKRGLVAIEAAVYHQGGQKERIDVSAALDGGLSFKSDYISDSGKKELGHVYISTKTDSFLKSDIKWSPETMQALFEHILKDFTSGIENMRATSEKSLNDVQEELNRVRKAMENALPNFNRLVDSYQQQIKALKEELQNDKSISEVSAVVSQLITGIADDMSVLIEAIANTTKALLKVINDLFSAISKQVNESLPALKQTLKNIIDALAGSLKVVIKELNESLKAVSAVLKEHHAEFEKLVGGFADIFHDVGVLISKTANQIYEQLSEFVKHQLDQLKDGEIYKKIKEKLKEVEAELGQLQLTENILSTIREFLEAVKQLVQIPEVHHLIESIDQYIEKHMDGKKKVDNEAELQEIYKKLIAAVRAVVHVLYSELIGELPKVELSSLPMSVPIVNLMHLPRLSFIRISLLSYLTSNDLPSLVDLINTYKPRLNPEDWVPPYTAYATLVDYQHIFSVDGRHLTFKGTCSYILSQDIIDGNFSIILNVQEGSVKSITIMDGSTSIDLKSDLSLMLNNAPHEYPLNEGDFSVWRLADTAHIKSKAGVEISCTSDYQICNFEISGYYFGKTRGLLGTINNEPWDDWIQPDGKIASKANPFGNSWKVNPSCADANNPDHFDHKESFAECDDLFSSSILRLCGPVIKPDNYIEACNHNVHDAKDKQKAACSIAAAYVQACIHEMVPVHLPASCTKCSSTQGDKINIGEVASYKVPQKSADVLVVFEQITDNAEILKDLVNPLVSSVTNELKTKGITDVRVSLFGYGGHGNTFPQHYTNAAGELIYEGKSKNIHLGEKETFKNVTFDNLENTWKFFKKVYEIGRHNTLAFAEIITYPFRAGATRTIVSVAGSSCEDNAATKLITSVATKLYNDLGITLHYVGPIEDVHLQGSKDSKQSKQIIGFDSQHVISIDGKKKYDISTDLRKDLLYKVSSCTEAAQSTHGTVFNSHALKSNKKQYLQALAQRVASSLTSAEITQQCTCRLEDGIHPRTMCLTLNRKEKQTEALTKGSSVKGKRRSSGV